MRNFAVESVDGISVADIGDISCKFSGVYPTAIDVCAVDPENRRGCSKGYRGEPRLVHSQAPCGCVG